MGFIRDLIDEGIDFGKEEARSRMRSQFGVDHIGAQNQATADMGRVLDRLKLSDYSDVDLDLAIRQIQAIASGFEEEYGHLGSRAAAGARDIWNLANRIVTDLERVRREGPGAGSGIIGGTRRLISSVSTTEMLLAGGVLLLLLSGGRRRS